MIFITLKEMINSLLEMVEEDESLFDLPVLLSADSEGNRHSNLFEASVETALKDPRNGWSWDLLSEEDEHPEEAIKVIVLWPVN